MHIPKHCQRTRTTVVTLVHQPSLGNSWIAPWCRSSSALAEVWLSPPERPLLSTRPLPAAQVPMPNCCQYTPDGADYWCASPSARALATALTAAMTEPAGGDYSATGAPTSLSIQQPLYNRVVEFDARVQHVCSQVGCAGSACTWLPTDMHSLERRRLILSSGWGVGCTRAHRIVSAGGPGWPSYLFSYLSQAATRRSAHGPTSAEPARRVAHASLIEACSPVCAGPYSRSSTGV